MRTKGLVSVLLLGACVFSCSDDEDKKSTLNVSMKSAGFQDLSLNLTGSNLTSTNFLSTSQVTVKSFQVPVGRINLTQGGSPSAGYTGTSPNFYGCSASTNEECMIDLVETDLDDLLDGGDGGEVVFNSSQEYTGTACNFVRKGLAGLVLTSMLS